MIAQSGISGIEKSRKSRIIGSLLYYNLKHDYLKYEKFMKSVAQKPITNLEAVLRLPVVGHSFAVPSPSAYTEQADTIEIVVNLKLQVVYCNHAGFLIVTDEYFYEYEIIYYYIIK